MKKIKILYCLQSITSGGVEQRRLTLARSLDQSRYELKIVCTFHRGKIAEDMASNGMEVIPIGSFSGPFDIKQYIKVLKVIRSFKPDIIHGGVFEGVTMATVAGFLGRVPIIIAEETSDPQNRSRKASHLLKLLTSVADKVVAIAPNVGEYLINIAKISPSKIRVITNGVKKPRPVLFSEIANLRSSLGIRETDFVIGSVGRLLDDHKRFTDIIKAVHLLKNKSDIKILLIGDGVDKEMISEVAHQLGLSDNLIMAGFQADTAPYYKLMDVFCLASQREGFGLVAAEAMYHQLPVVATKVGGLQDIVLENETGFLVDPKMPEQIADGITKLYKNRELSRSMGEKGKVRAEQEYSAERYVEEVEALYEELLVKKGVIKSKGREAAKA